MNRHAFGFAAAAASLALVALAGCRTASTTPDGQPIAKTSYDKVTFRSLDFKPQLSADVMGFREKPVVLATSTNNAGNTSNYGFDSVYGSFSYGNDAELLADVFYYAFLKTFQELKMPIFDYGYGGGPFWWGRPYYQTGPRPAGTPTLDLELTSITDHEFAIRVKGYINDVPALDKAFAVKGAPPSAAELASADAMAQRAYGMLGDTILTVLRDPDVRKLFGVSAYSAPAPAPAKKAPAKKEEKKKK